MRHEQNGSAGLADFVHFSQTLLLKRRVADRENLIDHENLRFEMRRHGEREADVHAARIAFDGRVDERADTGEIDDVVELALDLVAAHPENGAVEVDVLASRQFRMKTCTDFEQRPEAPPKLEEPFGRHGDA